MAGWIKGPTFWDSMLGGFCWYRRWTKSLWQCWWNSHTGESVWFRINRHPTHGEIAIETTHGFSLDSEQDWRPTHD